MISKKETDDIEGTTTKDDLFGELQWIDLEREALADNTNQAEKMISVKETGTTTQVDL